MSECGGGRARFLRDTRPAWLLCAAFVSAAIAFAGCAPSPPVRKEPGREETQWDCHYLGGELPVPERPDSTWIQRGGDLISVHSTAPRDGRFPGRGGREEAMADAVAGAADAALEVMGQRGVTYDGERRREIIDEAVRATASTSESPFPRFRIAESRWRECVLGEGDESVSASVADTAWSVSILVEYPIGMLRGDINNTIWERGRAVSEAEVLMASVEDRLDDGRWMAALVERARAVQLVRDTGIVFPPGAPYRDGSTASGDVSLDQRLRLVDEVADLTGAALATLSAVPVNRVEVVEVGARTGASASFRFTYRWSGRDVEAVGVPVVFGLNDAGAILRPEPVTDDAGVARCGIVAAYGPPGEYALSVAPDFVVISEADGSIERGLAGRQNEGDAASGTDLTDAGRQPSWAAVKVHLVDEAPATSVCAEFSGLTTSDVAQVSSGFRRRMEADGFTIEDCGASVDVILTAALTISSSENDGVWTARVSVSGSAFDQRTAAGLGEASFIVSEVSAEGQREAEVLALKESGRLLAAYFGSRILLQGE